MNALNADGGIDRLSVRADDASATLRLGALLGRAAADLGLGVLLELRGPLGAGKTTFSQGIGAGIGVLERVTSPTYALVHEHRAAHGDAVFVHVDLYRVGSEDEVRELALDESLADGAVVAIEWPERAGTVIEGAATDLIRIEFNPIVESGAPDEALDPDGLDEDRPRLLEFIAVGVGARRLLGLIAGTSGRAGVPCGTARE